MTVNEMITYLTILAAEHGDTPFGFMDSEWGYCEGVQIKIYLPTRYEPLGYVAVN